MHRICVCVLVSALALIIPAEARSQAMGFLAGPTTATCCDEHETTEGEISGTAAAFFAEFPVSGAIDIRAEVGYWQRGGRIVEIVAISLPDGLVATAGRVNSWRLRYVDVGLLLHARRRGSVANVGIMVGPVVSVFVDGEEVLYDGTARDVLKSSRGAGQDYLGVTSGLSFQFWKVVAELRYTLGEGLKGSGYGYPEGRHRTLGALLGFRFGW